MSDTIKEEWEAIFAPSSSSSHRDPNRAPTMGAPSTPLPPDDEAPSISETPEFVPDGGGEPPGGLAVGIATRVEAKDGSDSDSSFFVAAHPRPP